MLTSVGFEVLRTEMELPSLAPGIFGAMAMRTARTITIAARKLPSLWGAGRPFPACATFLAEFRNSHAAAIERRDRATPGGGKPVPFDIVAGARKGVAVFSPHPDDEVIGCGGTLLDLVAAGADVTIVQVTDGSDSAAFIDEPESVRRTVRLQEARAVGRRIGAREIVCLDADNRALRATPELQAQFREVLERTRAGLVFVPSFTDFHPDHQTVLQLLAGALTQTSRKPEVALYEVWSLVSPTHAHPVDDRIHAIEDLLLLYETALKIDDYVHLVAERLLHNACTYQGRSGYAEVFEIMPAERFIAIAAAQAMKHA